MRRTTHSSRDTLTSEIPSLTGMRGVAALIVVAFHLQAMGGASGLQGPVKAFISHGYLAVDLFFVLSGFVMSLNYQGLFAFRWKACDVRKFWLRRIARLYPMYLVGLAFAWRMSSRTPSITASEMLTNLFMVQNWGPWESINSPSWSISTEVFAYLLFPFAVGPLLCGARRWAVVASVIAIAGVLSVGASHTPASSAGQLSITRGALSIVRCVSGFTLGMLACRARNESWAQHLRYSPWVAYLVYSAVLLGMCLPIAGWVVLPLLPLVVITMSGQRNGIAAFLEWQPISRLGLYSYSIYLLHQTLLYTLPWRMEDLIRSVSGADRSGVCLGLDAIVLVLLSALTYHCAEEPGRRLLRRLFETPTASSGGSIA